MVTFFRVYSWEIIYSGYIHTSEWLKKKNHDYKDQIHAQPIIRHLKERNHPHTHHYVILPNQSFVYLTYFKITMINAYVWDPYLIYQPEPNITFLMTQFSIFQTQSLKLEALEPIRMSQKVIGLIRT